MPSDLWSLYGDMLRCRLYEEAVASLWRDGLISGEMHLGTGEEGVVAGVVDHLADGDAMALDHRATAALILRGLDPKLIIREQLGREDGLCCGMGGHMHLFSKDLHAASSGIVGAAGPAAAGFALAAQHSGRGAVAVAFFGEGAMNQGMLMESMNLASVWKLPVLFVCKDDGWSITTQSDTVTGGDLDARARALGVQAVEADGRNVLEVWNAAGTAIARAREGGGPTFLHARCVHLEGHFLGYQLLRIVRDPIREMPEVAFPLTASFLHPGGSGLRNRLSGLKTVLSTVLSTLRDPRRDSSNDPVGRARKALLPDKGRLEELEDEVKDSVSRLLESVTAEVPS